MTTVTQHPFGALADGAAVSRFLLQEGNMQVSLLTYGATIQQILVPDRNGKSVDVVLGYDTIEGYVQHGFYMGTIPGRVANRIGGASFTLNGQTYPLAANNGTNTLHGGIVGFDKQVWTAKIVENGVCFTLVSAHMQEGFPGELTASVTYTLQDSTLTLDYSATTDRTTLCNLTNHSYFNLAGHNSGDVLAQQVQLHCSQYTPADAGSIPTGEIATVAGTPMDLRTLQPIGAHIDDDFEALNFAGGYDHNFVVDGEVGTLRTVGTAMCEASGICLHVQTTMAGVQFYAGNFVGPEGPVGKQDMHYGKRSGFCLETQYFPDAIHHDNFVQPVLHVDEIQTSQTKFIFGTQA